MVGPYASIKLLRTTAAAPEAEEAVEDSVVVVATTKMAVAVEDMEVEDTLAAAETMVVDSAIKATVVAPAAEDGEVDSNNSPTAAAEEATAGVASKVATAVASRAAMTRTNSRVVVNENPKTRTVEQMQARAVGAHRSSFKKD